MFDSLQNNVCINFRLVPDGPILVRAQNVGLDPGAADMEFHRTTRDGKRTVFLAGSGIKGALRAHFERLLATSGRPTCDPTNTQDHRICGKQSLGRGSYRHAGQCPACYTFGSLKLAGRFRVGDAYPPHDEMEKTNLTEVRAGVGIDRKTQGAAYGVLYNTEVVVQGGFEVKVSGENFSLWQVALLLQVLDDFNSGFVQIGGCKSRGMGAVKIRGVEVDFRFLNGEGGFLTGARQFGEHFYGLPQDDRLEIGASAETSRRGDFFRQVIYKDEHAVRDLSRRLIDGPYAAYLAESRG